MVLRSGAGLVNPLGHLPRVRRAPLLRRILAEYAPDEARQQLAERVVKHLVKHLETAGFFSAARAVIDRLAAAFRALRVVAASSSASAWRSASRSSFMLFRRMSVNVGTRGGAKRTGDPPARARSRQSSRRSGWWWQRGAAADRARVNWRRRKSPLLKPATPTWASALYKHAWRALSLKRVPARLSR
jgi:hypothetical protein